MEDESDIYYTVKKGSEGMYKEKGSKFPSYLIPIESEEELKALIEALKKEHPNSRHFCYAFRLGELGDVYRYSDDGEPSGTAGKPIYGQLLSHNLTNVGLVVLRYFGGTKLGVSGLIHAYKESSTDAINQAQILKKFIGKHFRLDYPYEATNSVTQLLHRFDYEVKDQIFDEKCRQDIFIRETQASQFYSMVTKIKEVSVSDISK